MNELAMRPYLREAETRLALWLGVDLSRGGVARSVERHVTRRVQALGAPATSAWASLLDRPGSDEARALVEAATVPHSWLFRDKTQLAALESVLARRARAPLDVWIAGCANGEDAYTFASIALGLGHDVQVVATDVNETALQRGRAGTYSAFAAREVPRSARGHFRARETGGVVVTDALRARVRFARHSVTEAPLTAPRGGGWDVIVCRNVLIYFARPLATGIASRLASGLGSEGLLVLGASDVLAELPRGLVACEGSGRLVLRRGASGASVRDAPSESPPPVIAPRSAAPPPWSSVPTIPPRPSSPPSFASEPPGVEALVSALDRGALDEALALATGRLDEARGDAEAMLLAGLALFARGAYAEAAERFEAVCRRLPGAWVGWLHLGFSSERLGRWDEARRAFGRVPLAAGEGEDLPRGPGEVPTLLHGTRPHLVRLAMERVVALEGRGKGETR